MSCEDEVKTIDSYPFEISIIGTNEALITETIENELFIITENLADDTVFSFSYNANGKGFYKIQGSKIIENELYNFSKDELNVALEFVPEEEGEHTVDFFVTDNKEHSATVNTFYSITKEITDFEFSFVPGVSSLASGESTTINVDIKQTTDELLTYSMRIESNSNGEINWSERQNLPTTIDIFEQGNYSLGYIPSEVIDKNNFVVTLTASNGIMKTETFDGFEITPLAFDFSLSKNIINITENQANSFISITLNRPSFLTGLFNEPQYYLIISTSTDGILLDNGRTSFGTNIPLDDFTGTTNETSLYSLVYADTIIGGEMTFTVFNETGFEVSKTVTIEVVNL